MNESTESKERLMQAVFTDPTTTPRLTLREVAVPTPASNQALIKVEAFSLNQGETRTALAATKRYTPGWDFAGLIETAAVDGSTLKEGTRVFGFVAAGSWAEYIVAQAGVMAEIPEGITYAQAASLPVAGLTALTCLETAGSLIGRRVLVTGAAGGVGRFACQLAALAGAEVFAISRRPGFTRQLQEDGVQPAAVFTTLSEARAAGEYDVILDSVGGDTLATALTALARDGVCINCGNSARQPTTFNVRTSEWPFHRTQCIWVGREPAANNTPTLNRLIRLVKQGRLQAPIDRELPWTQVADAAGQLVQLQVNGKIILNVV